MPIRITGMNSGLDTEALVSELVSAYRTKTQKYTKAQTKLSWKQTAWKSLNTKVNTFYSNIRNLKYESAYSSKKATVSDSGKASVTATSTAATGTYSLKINQVAKTGYLTGAKLDTDITANSTLSNLGYTGTDGKISVKANGKTTNIDVTGSTTVSDFVKALNDAGVKANFDANNHRIFVTAAKSGKENDFTLTGSNIKGNEALAKLGLSVGGDAAMDAYKAYAAYARNENGEAYITYDSDGNAVTNGTLSLSKTHAYVSDVKTELGNKSALQTNNNAKIAYANAYKTVQEADPKLTDAEKTMFKTLGGETDLTNVFVDNRGDIYDKQEDGTYVKRGTGDTVERFTEEELANQGITLTSGSDKLADLETTAGITGASYAAAQAVLDQYASSRDDVDADAAESAYVNGTLDAYLEGLNQEIEAAQKYISDNSLLMNDTSSAYDLGEKVVNAAKIVDGSVTLDTSNGAVRIWGQDTEIVLNNAVFTDTDTELSINGLNISAIAETSGEISINVTNDSQGMYDKIKGFIKEYNTLINEMTSMYNADSSKGYEPLTSEEKDAMTDTEVEEWEKKIKDSLLRRDDQLDSLMSIMKNAMFKSYQVNGKSYSLSSFGISTLGVLNAADNEENAFHINGDSEDSAVSGNADKLLAALQDDPDTVADFMQQLATGLYDALGKKMSSSTLSSFGVVYNDKEMAREYSDYTQTISKWEEKLNDIEDSYYKKFAAMESILGTLQSQQSSLAGLLG